MKKILIVSGDSFSDPDFRSGAHPDMDVSWPKWPELLAEKWDMKLINLSQAGSGNEYIYSRLQDIIMKIQNKSKIGMVIASWSQAHRWDYQICMGHKSYWDSNMRWSWENERVQPKGDIIGWMRKSIRNYLALQILCERYDLPYIQFSMMHPYINFLNGLWPTENDITFRGKDYIKDKMKYPGKRKKDEAILSRLLNETSRIIDIEKFPGWPLAIQHGGYALTHEILKYGTTWEQEKQWVISELDQHPNAKGQEKICEFIKEKSENIYDGLG